MESNYQNSGISMKYFLTRTVQEERENQVGVQPMEVETLKQIIFYVWNV